MDDDPLESGDAIRLLEETHCFPCEVMVKVIGHTQGGFVERALEAIRDFLSLADVPEYRSRVTPNGKYTSITLEPRFDSAGDVLRLYRRMQAVEGVIMVM